MTTSGTTTYNPAVEEIIDTAYENIGLLAEDESATSSMFQNGLRRLNSMVKMWMATGIHVWTEEEAILFLQPAQVRYLLGPSTQDNCTDSNSVVLTTLASSASAGAATLTVTDASDMEDTDKIGIVLDDGTTQWTTLDSNPTGNSVPIVTALTSAAASGNAVFSYVTRIDRPLKVPFARQYAVSSAIECSMTQLSRQEYMSMPNKTSLGMPVQFFYSPKLTNGEFYVWPAPSNSGTAVRLTWYRPIEDFLTANNTSDFPQEWLHPLTWNLAVELAGGMSVPDELFNRATLMAAQSLDLVRGWDRESEPIFFQMDFGPGR